MRKICISLVITAISLSSACAAVQPPEINGSAFRSHFANEEKCSAFVDKLVFPAANKMAGLRRIADMRDWLTFHQEYSFSRIVTSVRHMTQQDGVLIPTKESDQIKVTRSIYSVLERLPGFSESGCGPDVHEVVMRSFYDGIGGIDSSFSKNLLHTKMEDPWEQQWILLTAIMAAQIPANWE